jgi:excinuclease ABC subunit C
MNDLIRDKYKRAPHKPGVYIFRGPKNFPLYIGKSIDIKKRLASYVNGRNNLPRIVAMIIIAQDVEWIVTDNELEALVLEANLIRQYKPRYNVALKDDKRYPYLKISREAFPRITVVRHKQNDGAVYFGPYADRIGAMKLGRLIRRLFRIRVCKYNLPTKRKIRACMLKDIGRCIAPCENPDLKEQYQEHVNEVIMFLKGKRMELLDKLKKQMNRASEEMKFEEAAKLRDTISQLTNLLTPQKMDRDTGDSDFVTIAFGGGVGVAMIFRIRQGAMIARQTVSLTIPKKISIEEALGDFVISFYCEDPDTPPRIYIPVEISEPEEIERTLTVIRGAIVTLKIPKRGEKYDIMQLLQRNAELIHGEMMIQKEQVHVPYGVLEFERLLQLPKTPNRIEGFDISNFGSQTIVASMVQFIGGKSNKSGYRHYKIKSTDYQNDFASMREVVYRRYRRLLNEDKKLPDLILIDGGKGQLSAALSSLSKLGLEEKIFTISIAKRLDELFLPGRKDSINLPRDSSALRLIKRIRDESHRFAILYSRKSHRKQAMKLELCEIPGIGQKRAEQMLKRFGGTDSIAILSVDKLVEKVKLPRKLAERVLEKLNED